MEARPRHPTGDSSGLIFTQPSSPQHSALRLMSKNSCALLFHFPPTPHAASRWGLAKWRRSGGWISCLYAVFAAVVSLTLRLLPLDSSSVCAVRRGAECGWEENRSQAFRPQRTACWKTRANNISRETFPPRGSFAATLLVCESPLFKEKMKRVISGNCFLNTLSFPSDGAHQHVH